MRYEQIIAVPKHITVEILETVIDKIREVGTADLINTPTRIKMSINGPRDEQGDPPDVWDGWTVREVLAELELELESYGMDWKPDRSFLVEP